MIRLLLDTTFLIDLERGSPDLAWPFLDEDDFAIAAISIAELEVGLHQAQGRFREKRQTFIDDVHSSMYVIPYDAAVAREHGRLMAHVRRSGRPRGGHDLMIAATAVATERAVVSGDRSAFIDLPGVVLLDA